MNKSDFIVRRREYRLFGMILFPAALLLGVLYYSHTLEDAFITFRYAEHLADGYGMGAWNIGGVAVEGYSTPLWMGLMALCSSLGINMLTASKTIGIASHALLVLMFLTAAMKRRRTLDGPDSPLQIHRDVFILAGAMCAFNLPLAWYASSGMESLSFICLIALLLLGPLLIDSRKRLQIVAPAAAVLLVLLRPEGILFAVLISAVHMLRARGEDDMFRVWRTALLGGVVAFAALLIMRLIVFGEFLPNTYYAKADGGLRHWMLGGVYMYRWLTSHVPVVFVIAVCAMGVYLNTRRQTKDGKVDERGLWRRLQGFEFILFLLLLPLLYVVYIVKVGGDDYSAFPLWRHMLHLLPFWALTSAAGICLIMPKLRWGRYALMFILVAAMNGKNLMVRNAQLLDETRKAVLEDAHLQHRPPNPFFTWIQSMSDENTLIASSFGGELPFVVDARHIDVLGLNDPHIAREGTFDPAGPVDSKTDMDYVVRQRPDFVEGYISMAELMDCEPRSVLFDYRTQMSQGLIDNPLFRREYLLVLNAPYETMDRALFIRRDFWEQHSARAQIKVRELEETCLYGSLEQ